MSPDWLIKLDDKSIYCHLKVDTNTAPPVREFHFTHYLFANNSEMHEQKKKYRKKTYIHSFSCRTHDITYYAMHK